MQSHEIERTCRVVEPSAGHRDLSESFSSIEKALFAAAELAARQDEPCIVCGLAPEEPERWARGTQPVPVAVTTRALDAIESAPELDEPDAQDILFEAEVLATSEPEPAILLEADVVAEPLEPLEPIPPVPRELCEPDMIISADFRMAAQSKPVEGKRNPLIVALGAVLMAVGAHYIFTSLGIRR